MDYLHSETYNNSKSQLNTALILFLLWPFAGLFVAFRYYRQDWAKNIFWLFCVFIGFTYIFAEERGADSYRYAIDLIKYARSQMNLLGIWRTVFSENTDLVDFASPTIIFLVSRITDNPKILFTILALIFGFFYSRNLWYILDRMNTRPTLFILLCILTIILLNPVWNINGFRMWTAAQIFIYGTLPYFVEGKKKGLLWAGFSVFFHFSFLFPLGILGIFMLLKNRINIFMGFLILTAFIKEIDLLQVQSALLFLPDIFHHRITSYTRPEYAESINMQIQEANWYGPFAIRGLTYVSYAVFIYIFFFARKILNERPDLKTLFCYSLLLYGFTNIFSYIPSGDRFLYVVDIYVFAFLIFFLSSFPKIKGRTFLEFMSTPLILLFCMVAIRISFDRLGLMTFIGNPVVATFFRETVPLIEGIKTMLF